MELWSCRETNQHPSRRKNCRETKGRGQKYVSSPDDSFMYVGILTAVAYPALMVVSNQRVKTFQGSDYQPFI